jgi:hypothetical protein
MSMIQLLGAALLLASLSIAAPTDFVVVSSSLFADNGSYNPDISSASSTVYAPYPGKCKTDIYRRHLYPPSSANASNACTTTAHHAAVAKNTGQTMW